ncbi:MAG: hypothetical protein ACFCU5_10130 [Pleurocapsa sp.]
MKQLVKIMLTAIALAMAIVTHVGETVSFTPEDLQLLKQLACAETGDRFRLEPSLPETLAIYSWDLSQQQIDSAYTEAVQIQIQSDRETATKVKKFCAELNS